MHHLQVGAVQAHQALVKRRENPRVRGSPADPLRMHSRLVLMPAAYPGDYCCSAGLHVLYPSLLHYLLPLLLLIPPRPVRGGRSLLDLVLELSHSTAWASGCAAEERASPTLATICSCVKSSKIMIWSSRHLPDTVKETTAMQTAASTRGGFFFPGSRDSRGCLVSANAFLMWEAC